MNSPLSRILPLSVLLAVGACHGETDDVSPEPRSVDITQGRAVSIALSGAPDHDRIEAIARHIEGLGGEVATARVEVIADSEAGGSTMVVELWGAALPDEARLRAGLAEQFPELSPDQIAVESLDPANGPTATEVHSDAEDPEVARQEIIDRLRAQGVEGDIVVDVEDDHDGRRVEVQIDDRRTE